MNLGQFFVVCVMYTFLTVVNPTFSGIKLRSTTVMCNNALNANWFDLEKDSCKGQMVWATAKYNGEHCPRKGDWYVK